MAKAKSTLKVKQHKSAKDVKKASKKGGGAGRYISNVTEGGIKVRFLDEPGPEWLEYQERYDEKRDPKYFPLDDELEAYYKGSSDRVSVRFLVNVLDVENKSVIPLKLPKSLVTSLMQYYEKRGTLLDRDYTLDKEGAGMDTTYMAFPEDPKPRKIKELTAKKHDLMKLLNDQVAAAKASEGKDDDDDDDDEKPKKRSKRGSTGKTRSSSSKDKGKKSKKSEPRKRVKEVEKPAKKRMKKK
jgi:hypothetical protein